MKLFCCQWSRVWACDKRFLHHFWPAHSANSSFFFFFRLVLFTGCCLNIHCHPQTSYGNIRLYKVHLNSPSFQVSVHQQHHEWLQNTENTQYSRSFWDKHFGKPFIWRIKFWSTAIKVSTLGKCSDISNLLKYQYKSQTICDKVKLSLLLKIDLFDYSVTHLACS